MTEWKKHLLRDAIVGALQIAALPKLQGENGLIPTHLCSRSPHRGTRLQKLFGAVQSALSTAFPVAGPEARAPNGDFDMESSGVESQMALKDCRDQSAATRSGPSF